MQSVYVSEDTGQPGVSLQWVISQKFVYEKVFSKARSAAWGFEEEQNISTDSSSCSREGVRLALACIASNVSKVNSIGIKTAFLQGMNAERTVYIRPSRETKMEYIEIMKGIWFSRC